MSMEKENELVDDLGEVYDKLTEEEVVEDNAEDVVEEIEEEVVEENVEGEDNAEEEAEPEVAEEQDQEQDQAEEEVEESEEEEAEHIEPLAHWLREDKKMFAELEPKAQEFLIRRDKEFQRQATEKANEVMHLKRALDPVRDEIAQHGISDDQAVRTLVGAHMMLQQKPKQAIQHLMSQYGITPETLFSEDDPTPVTDPRVDALENKVTAYEQGELQRRQAELYGRLVEFKKNAEFWDDVQDQMVYVAQVERSRNPNVTPDIEVVYNKACLMNDRVAGILENRKLAGANKATSTKRSKNAAGAKVKPTAATKKSKPETKPTGQRATIAAIWDELEERDKNNVTL